MTATDFTTTIMVDQSPKQAFDAINNVRGWWSEEIEGDTESLNAEFKYHYEDVHSCKMKITELIPSEKVVWLVLENYFKFTSDKPEWPGTQVCFEISQSGGKTAIRFSHIGLVPEFECFDICSRAWTQYVQQSLYNLITTGIGQPNAKGKPTTTDEERLGTAAIAQSEG
jgi:hypothetical protein